MTSRPRQSQFTDEVLALFAELDRTPPRRRRSRAFQDAHKRLMCTLLNLGAEFWTMNSVLESGPCSTTPQYVAYGHWHTCRTVRAALLEAVAAREAQPADEPAHPAP
jgi:hypothetical protein